MLVGVSYRIGTDIGGTFTDCQQSAHHDVAAASDFESAPAALLGVSAPQ
jgi:hypothetical protein